MLGGMTMTSISEFSTEPDGRTQSDYDREYLYPPSAWAQQVEEVARTQAAAIYTDLINERNHWKIRAELAEARWTDIPWAAICNVLAAVEGKRAPGATHTVHIWLDTHAPEAPCSPS
jgi:hypothetical protein